MSMMSNTTLALMPEGITTPPLPEIQSRLLLWTVTGLFTYVIVWRFWKFTLYPTLYPASPKEYPYWFIFFGHGLSFFRDSNGLIMRARSHFKDSKDPFALTAFGQNFYVITQVKQCAEVYKNSETLSFEGFVQDLMRTNGIKEYAIEVMYKKLPQDKSGFPNPKSESLGVLAQKMHIHQLHPMHDQLILIQKKVQDWINSNLVLEKIPGFSDGAVSVANDAKQVEVSLYHWSSDMFVQLGQDVYFGDTLGKDSPDAYKSFVVFDELIYKALYQYPGFLSKDMAAGRTGLVAAIEKYLRLPKEERRDAAWLISNFEDEMASIDIGVEDMAICIFHLYLAINTNTRKTIFWVLTFLLHNPDLLEIFRKETEPAFDGDVLVDGFYITDKCPQVSAIWHETLRMTSWSASIRLILKDTIIGGKILREGNRVIVPHRLQHFDEDVFGEDINEFRHERWLQKDLTKSPSWHPFGAGKTLCSGRFVAKYSVLNFVATILRRFDLEMVGNPRFPQGDEGKPVLGIISVKEGYDYRVRLTPRAIKT